MKTRSLVLLVMVALTAVGVASAAGSVGSVQEVLVKGQTTLSDTYDSSTIYPWFGRLTYTHVVNVSPHGASVSKGLSTKARVLCEHLFTSGGKDGNGNPLYPMVQIYADLNGQATNLSNAPSAYQVDKNGNWKRSAYPGPEAMPHGTKVWAVAGYWDSLYNNVASEIQKTTTYKHKTILVDCQSNITKTLTVP